LPQSVNVAPVDKVLRSYLFCSRVGFRGLIKDRLKGFHLEFQPWLHQLNLLVVGGVQHFAVTNTQLSGQYLVRQFLIRKHDSYGLRHGAHKPFDDRPARAHRGTARHQGRCSKRNMQIRPVHDIAKTLAYCPGAPLMVQSSLAASTAPLSNAARFSTWPLVWMKF